MTGNRLTAAASANAFSSIEEMREWCWDRNVMARDAGSQRWLYVSQDKDTGLHSIKARNGADAADVIAVVRGWYPDFKGWETDRLESEFRILRHMARMGMTEERAATIRFAKPAVAA